MANLCTLQCAKLTLHYIFIHVEIRARKYADIFQNNLHSLHFETYKVNVFEKQHTLYTLRRKDVLIVKKN